MDQTLNTLARAAYTASAAKADSDSAADEAAAGREFLDIARRCAKDVLGEAANDLPWRYTPWAQSPEGSEEAVAVLEPGRAHSFALHYIRTDDSVTFALAASCVGCGCRTLTPVISLQHLGQLLEEADGQDQHRDDDSAAEEPGPLATADRLESAAGWVSALLRQIVARHPEAGLTTEFASIYGHHVGTPGGSLRLGAATAEAVMEIAPALGAEAVVTVSDGGHGAYVFRWARVSYDVGDFEVQISGSTRLSDEEEAAWRATHTGTPGAAETGGEG
ncbi:hypothetical protein ABTY96_46710 [Streptomyces sp. NPDC096057]|uniref:hypothetical protein n=1 Tax=Streptomyces sp. NPDC096057 TaxID=3155543 RepID=UPI0033289A13